MFHIWRMWRMVRKLSDLQKTHIELQVRDSTIEERSRAIYTRTVLYVPRDNLSIKDMGKSVVVGTTENFVQSPRDFDKSQDTIESCVAKGFIKPQEGDTRMIALTAQGLEFRDPFYLLKYLISELGVVWAFLGTIAGTVLLKDSILFLGNVLWEAAKIAISSL
ncbi:MAG TPA: hypothetical protein VJC15_03975 [Candidatus Paceibacterota bacterium]